jgi:deoxyadenosine/deoxycytidine kinase
MRIGLCGTMSVGKTTLVKALQELPEFQDYHFATERSKYLRDLGIPLNTDSTVRGQFVFMAERASELMYDNLITDRTIWDVCAFTLSAKSISWYYKQSLIEAASSLMSYYDIVFYINPEGIGIEDNGVRETDSQYRNDINYAIVELLQQYKPNKLVEIKGTTEERIQQIKEALNL